MNRRQILKYAVTLTGTALLAPIIGCSEKVLPITEPSDALLFFKPEEFKVLTQLMDVILPKTDTPSASEVKVNYVLDQLLANVFDLEYRQSFTDKFSQLSQYLTQNNFDTLSGSAQEKLLTSLESLPEAQRNNAYWSYLDIKQQTVTYYLSSEEIAENHLNYLPVPGEYKPCVSVEELGNKAWAI